MRKLKVIQGGRAAPAPRKKRRRPKPITSASIDPRAKVLDRTFEFTTHHLTSEHLIEKKIRIRAIGKAGIEDHVFEVGDRQCYFGMISEETKPGKWTPYTWGHFPVSDLGVCREVFIDEPPPVAPLKKDAKE